MSDFALEFAFAPAAVANEETDKTFDGIAGIDIADDGFEVAANVETRSVFACTWDDVGAEGVDEEYSILTAWASTVDGHPDIGAYSVEEFGKGVIGEVIHNDSCGAFTFEVVYYRNNAVGIIPLACEWFGNEHGTAYWRNPIGRNLE